MQDARPAPLSSVVSAVGGVVIEVGLVFAYALMFVLTVLVVSASAIAYAAFVIPRLLTRRIDGGAVGPRLRGSNSASTLWNANPNVGRR